jgi:hypothetical protein
MLGPGAILAARELGFSSLFDEPGNDTLAMVSLNLDDAILARTPATAQSFQRLGNLVSFALAEAMNDADHAGTPSLASDTDHPVGGHWRLGHKT